VKNLAKLTRGLIKEDIIESVTKYIQKGLKPEMISHPTNTCDPMTGNWAEHLVSIEEYKELTANNNFSLEVKSGFYNTQYKLKVLNLITPIVNMLIQLLPQYGLFSAPFMVLYCKRSNQSTSSKSTYSPASPLSFLLSRFLFAPSRIVTSPSSFSS